MGQIGFVLPDRLYGCTPTQTIEFASLADRSGFDSVWMGESSANNGLMLLAAIARATEDAQVGSSVANVFSRSPSLLAMSANLLSELSDGRAILGVGVSSRPMIERWHGLAFEQPLRRLRESIEIVRAAFRSERIDYDGEVFDVGPYSTRHLDRAHEPPIYNAAIGETNRALTGEFADGWLPMFQPLSKIQANAEHVASCARAAGRDPPTVAPYIPTAVDPDTAAAEDRVRSLLAQELGMGYDRVMAEYGYGNTAEQVRDAWREGDREAAKRLLTDEILSEFAVYGPAASCREQLDAYRERGVDIPLVWPSFDATENDIERLVRELGEKV